MLHPAALYRPISSLPFRPTQTPRLVIFHTNAGGSSTDGAALRSYIERQLEARKKNPSIASPTQPHHQVDLDGTIWQYLPYDRQGTASYRANPFSIAVETQDYGTKAGSIEGQLWTPAQLDALVSVVVEAHRLFDIPVTRPDTWDGAGVGTHSMWGYNTLWNMNVNPWTNVRGKTCPGAARKAQLDEIIWRAAEALKPQPAPELPLTAEQIRSIRMADKPTISPFDANYLVTYLQVILATEASQPVEVSGVFDGATYEAVKLVQIVAGLTVDGIVGPQTWPTIDLLADRLLAKLEVAAA